MGTESTSFSDFPQLCDDASRAVNVFGKNSAKLFTK